MYKCPECGSTRIGQLRQMTGEMWCDDCGVRVAEKELPGNPFIVKGRFNG